MPRKNIETIYPLSSMQAGMLFHSRKEPDTGVYIEQLRFTLEPLNAAIFRRAWEVMFERFTALRTSIVSTANQDPVQVVRLKVDLPWQEHDCRRLSTDDQAEWIKSYLDKDSIRGFKLEKPSLVRLMLVRLTGSRYEFIWSLHHIALDGWSGALIQRDLFHTYAALLADQQPELPPVPVFRNYISHIADLNLADAEGYWRKTLRGFDKPTFISGNATNRDSRSIANYAEESLLLSTESSFALRTSAAAKKVTLNTLFQAAWSLLLARYANTSDVLFGAVVSGRSVVVEGVESMVGMLVNTLPLRVRIPPGKQVESWLQGLQADQAKAQQFQQTPLWRVHEWSDVAATLPLFESLFVFENIQLPESYPDLKSDLNVSFTPPFDRTGYPLVMLVIPTSKITLRVTFDADHYSSELIRRLLKHYRQILMALAGAADMEIDAIELADEAEYDLLLNRLNCTDQPFPEDGCLHQLFEDQVDRQPDTPAIYFGLEQLTYGQLETRANRLANYLLTLGVTADFPVCICLPRSLEMMVAVLAVLKAGGAYVPLDPGFPTKRMADMQNEIDASLVITNATTAHALPATEALKNKPVIVYLDKDSAEITAHSKSRPPCVVKPHHLLYVLYTSGSTGRPKAVGMPHAPLVNLIHWQMTESNVRERQATLQFAPLGFDVSCQEMFATFGAGGLLCVLTEEERRDPVAMLDLIEKRSVARVFLPFVALSQMAEIAVSRKQYPSSLKEVITAGEQLRITPALREFFSHLENDCVLINHYGPTECHAASSYTLQGSPHSWPDLPPIGRPIANARLYLLDDKQQPVAMGLTGELYIGGTPMARGYLNQSEKTRERFLDDPFQSKEGARLYRSGDLARYHSDGNIQFLGRVDNQVKVRGFRVEPGEIETALTALAQVEEALVLVREDTPGIKSLVAYVVLSQTETVTAESLRIDLANQLPDYMIPGDFVPIDAFPLSPSGKINRMALPAPMRDRAGINDEYAEPRTPLERTLAQLWQEILMLTEPPGVNDNFFELGGHSLLSARLVNQVEKQLGKNLPLNRFFENPTISRLAAELQRPEESRIAKEPSESEQPRQNRTWLPSVLYHKILSYTGSWLGERVASESLIVGKNTKGKRPPLFWVFQGHEEFRSLARHLGPDQPLYGMRSGHLVMDYAEDEVQALALHYVQEIICLRPDGPLLVGGNCQASGIALPIAQHLQRRQRQVPLLFLMEWSFPLFAYNGPVVLLFGRESDVANPYLHCRNPELAWRRAWPNHRVEIIAGAHGQFFRQPNVQVLAATVERCISEAQEDTPNILPLEARRAKIEILQAPDVLIHGSHITLVVRVHNLSKVNWAGTEQSGLMVASRWLLPDGQPYRLKDGRAPLPALASGGMCTLSVPVSVPDQHEELLLSLQIIEEGIQPQWWDNNGGEIHSAMRLEPPGLAANVTLPDLADRFGSPLLIGGSGGSGTRVVAQILTEAGVFLGENQNSGEDKLDMPGPWSATIQGYLNRNLPEHIFHQTVRDFNDQLTTFLAPLDGSSRHKLWGWKLPSTVFFMPIMQRIWPEVRCIHVVCDGRDVALSPNQNQLFHLGPGVLSDSELLLSVPHRSARLWDRLNSSLAQYGQTEMQGRYLQVRYEDLCERPLETIERILTFTGTQADARELAELVQPSPGHGRWRAQAQDVIAELTTAAYEGLSRFGYLEGEIEPSGSVLPHLFSNTSETSKTASLDASTRGDFDTVIQLTGPRVAETDHMLADLADALLHTRRYSEAAIRYQQALVIDNSNPELWLCLGLAEQGADNGNGAIDAFFRALDHHLPDPVPAMQPLLLLLGKNKQRNKALGSMTEALKRCPTNLQLRVLASSFFLITRDPESAIHNILKLMKLAPDSPDLLVPPGRRLIKIGYSESNADIDLLLDRDLAQDGDKEKFRAWLKEIVQNLQTAENPPSKITG